MLKFNFLKAALILLIFVSLLFTTCETLQSFIQEPVVTLRSVEIVNISFSGVDILCRVNVDNRSPVSIPFPDIDWELFINAGSFIRGGVDAGSSIRSRDTTVVDIPVSLSYVDIFNMFRSLRDRRSAEYRIALGASLDLPYVGQRTWRFEHAGFFPVLQMPRLTAPSMRIGDIDFSRIQLLFTVNVENQNDFELPAPRIIYDFLVDRNPYLNGIHVSAAPLAAAAITPVVIALTLEYADIFRLFQNLVNLNEFPSLFSMNSDFGIPAFAGESSSQQIPGSIPIPRMPVVRFGGISMTNLSLTRVDFELVWEIENNNNFAMNLNELFYDFRVNNSVWSSGRAPRFTQINPNRTVVIPIEFSINNLSIVREITDIVIRGTDISYTCTGGMSLGAAFPGLPDLHTPFHFAGNTRLFR